MSYQYSSADWTIEKMKHHSLLFFCSILLIAAFNSVFFVMSKSFNLVFRLFSFLHSCHDNLSYQYSSADWTTGKTHLYTIVFLLTNLPSSSFFASRRHIALSFDDFSPWFSSVMTTHPMAFSSINGAHIFLFFFFSSDPQFPFQYRQAQAPHIHQSLGNPSSLSSKSFLGIFQIPTRASTPGFKVLFFFRKNSSKAFGSNFCEVWTLALLSSTLLRK